MYKKLLIPLDGSRLSEAILPYARLIAKELGLPVDLLHASTNPVLVAKGTTEEQSHDGEATVKRIIVPLDGSPLAELALPHATFLAKALNAALDLIRVSSALTDAHYGAAVVPAFEEQLDFMREEAKNYLDTKAEHLGPQGAANASCIVETGDAGTRIIELARETPNSLVTMCSHGRSGMGRWIFGSTTERVVRYSGDPVLVIHASE